MTKRKRKEYYQAGEQVATLPTDKEGKAKIEDLYLGEYFAKEIPPLQPGIWQMKQKIEVL